MNKLSSEEGGGFHEEVLQKYTGGHLDGIHYIRVGRCW